MGNPLTWGTIEKILENIISSGPNGRNWGTTTTWRRWISIREKKEIVQMRWRYIPKWKIIFSWAINVHCFTIWGDIMKQMEKILMRLYPWPTILKEALRMLNFLDFKRNLWSFKIANKKYKKLLKSQVQIKIL